MPKAPPIEVRERRRQVLQGVLGVDDNLAVGTGHRLVTYTAAHGSPSDAAMRLALSGRGTMHWRQGGT